MEMNSCEKCSSKEHGSKVDRDFICFRCNVLSSDDAYVELTKDETGWWMKKFSMGRFGGWIRVAIDANHSYDEAFDKYINDIILK